MRLSAEITLQPSPSAAALGHSRTEVSQGHQVSATTMSTAVTVQSSGANTKPFKKRYLMENRSPSIDSVVGVIQQPELSSDAVQPQGHTLINCDNSQELNESCHDNSFMNHVHSSISEKPFDCVSPSMTSSDVSTSAVPVRWPSPMDSSDGNSSCAVSSNNGCSYSSPGSLALYTATSHASDAPLNLSTSLSAGGQQTAAGTEDASVSEVQLSSLVEHLVERMLSQHQRQGHAQTDSLGDWFSNQFDSRHSEEFRSSEATLATSAGMLIPACMAAPLSTTSSRGRHAASNRRRCVTSRRRHTTGSVVSEVAVELTAAQTTPRLIPDSTIELTIGMTDTINHVIDTIFSHTQNSANDDDTNRDSANVDVEMSSIDKDTTVNSEGTGLKPNDARLSDSQIAVVQQEVTYVETVQCASSPLADTTSAPASADSSRITVSRRENSPGDSSYMSGCEWSSASKPTTSSTDSENSSGSALSSHCSFASGAKPSPASPTSALSARRGRKRQQKIIRAKKTERSCCRLYIIESSWIQRVLLHIDGG